MHQAVVNVDIGRPDTRSKEEERVREGGGKRKYKLTRWRSAGIRTHDQAGSEVPDKRRQGSRVNLRQAAMA